jgi:hypothetical protein
MEKIDLNISLFIKENMIKSRKKITRKAKLKEEQ